MFCLLEDSLLQSQYELYYISTKCIFVRGDCVLFFLFQVIKPVRGKDQMSFCSFLVSFFSLIKVGTFFSSRVFPKTTLCSKWGHCLHFLIQWQKLWESSMLLVVQAKRCKWLYWKSMCSYEVLPISEFLTICSFAPMSVTRKFTAVCLSWRFYFFSCVFYHEQKVKGSFGVLFVYSLEDKRVTFFSFWWQELNWHWGVQLSPTMLSHKWGQIWAEFWKGVWGFRML